MRVVLWVSLPASIIRDEKRSGGGLALCRSLPSLLHTTPHPLSCQVHGSGGQARERERDNSSAHTQGGHLSQHATASLREEKKTHVVYGSKAIRFHFRASEPRGCREQCTDSTALSATSGQGSPGHRGRGGAAVVYSVPFSSLRGRLPRVISGPGPWHTRAGPS